MPYLTTPQNMALASQQLRPELYPQSQSMFGSLAPVTSMFGNIGNSVGNWAGNNSGMLTMAGLGLLAGNTPQQGFANAMRGIQAGTEMDQTSADRKQAKADRKRLDDAIAGLTNDQSGTGPMAGLSAPVRNLMAADPGFASSVISSRLSPKADDWQRLSDGSLYKPSTGETKGVAGAKREIRNDANGVPRYTDTGEAIYQSDQNASGGTQFFSGRSVQAQGLNYLIGQGTLTKEQAANVAAGKAVTGPNGEIIYMTPQGLVTQPGPGGQQQQDGQNQGSILTGPKMSEDMRKAAGFASRAAAADQIVSDPTISGAGQSLTNRGMASVPVFGNKLVPEAYQQFDQSQRDFVNAVLRRESGAAISQSEFENAQKQYFPQPGDGPEVLAQKAANRRLAIQSLNQSGTPVPTFGAQQGAAPSGPMRLPSGGTLAPHPDGSYVWSPQ